MKKTIKSNYLLILYYLVLLFILNSCIAAAIEEDAFPISNESSISQISIAPLNPTFVQYVGEMEQIRENASSSSNTNEVPLSCLTLSGSSINTSSPNILKSISFLRGGGLVEGHRPTGLIPSPVDLSHLSSVNMQELMASEEYGLMSSDIKVAGMDVYPSRFDLRDNNGVTAVRDQGNAGSCWTHSTIASLESYLLYSRSEDWDFSENNVKNILVTSDPDGFDRIDDDGGFDLMTAAYLSRWSGPVLESDDPYNYASGISPTNAKAAKHVQDIFILPGFDGNDTLYKWMITNYGAVSVAFYYDGSYFNEENNSYFYDGEVVEANHAVALVGWNDNYNRSNFTPAAPENGAFILKNSWGDNWGEDGYFYVSYYDTVMGNNEGMDGIDTKPYIGNFMFTAENVSNYDFIYQYDPLGWDGCAGYNNTTAYGANVFTAISNETLEAVSFYTVDSNAFYNICIYLDPESGPINSSGPVSLQNGSIPIAGYHTIDLDTNVSLLSSQNFSVVVKFTTPSYNYPIAIEMPVPEYSSYNAHSEPGQSYMSRNGTVWEDLGSDRNVCIKAFTTEGREPYAAFVSGTRYVHVNETVDFHDISLLSPYTWQWDFGDGSISAVQNPLHVYMNPGIYNVSLNVSNSFGSNVSLRNSFIHVINSTIVVNSSGSADFTTIFEAVDAASDGDTILVEPGVYVENLWFTDDNISLLSSTGNHADVNILSPDHEHDAISIVADNITISGINISDSFTGLSLYNSQNSTIFNCTINHNVYGLYVTGSENNYFAGNSIEDNTYNCRFGQEINSVSISNTVNRKPIYYLINTSDLIINPNSNAAFVHLINCSNITIEDLEIKHNYYALYLYNSNNVTISNCTSTDSRYGVYLSSSTNNTIYGCNISRIVSDGLLLTGSSDNLVYNNYFNNTNNVYAADSSSNYWNITMTSGNNIINGPYLGGNFWAKPDGAGWSQIQYSVENGFCQPYEITADNNNTDYLPLTGNEDSNKEQPELIENNVPSNNDGVHVRIATSSMFSENVLARDSNIRFVGKDTETHYVFTDGSTPVTYISFDAVTNEGYVMATVNLLNEVPENIPIFTSLKVYRTMDIVLGDKSFSFAKIGKATIGFAVSKEWLASNILDNESIHMEHFSDGLWNRLPTTRTKEDAEYLYFEAITTGFSPFIICADVTNENMAVGAQTSAIVVDNSSKSTGASENVQSHTNEEKVSKMLILSGLIMVGIICIVYWKKKNNN